MRAIRRYTRSSSVALGGLFSLVLLLGVFFAAYFIIVAGDETLTRDAGAAIDADMRGFREVAATGGRPAVDRLLAARLGDPRGGFYYALKEPDGRIAAGNLAAWPGNPVTRLREGVISFELPPPPEGTARPPDAARDSGPSGGGVLSAAAEITGGHRVIMAKILTLDDGAHLLIGRGIDDLRYTQWFARTFGWVMIGVFLLIAGTSLSVGLYVVNRINRIADTADRIISTGNLSARLPVDSSWDDLSKLSMALNRMLDELQALVDGVKSVSDSIAHDLRTPLTRLRGHLEAVDDADRRDALLRETDNILAIFNGLLRITEIETRKQTSAFRRTDLAPILRDVAEMYQPLAEDKGLALMVETVPAPLFGDRDLLFQMISNLVDNAVKFTPAGGRIHLRLDGGAETVALDICDSGIGVPPGLRQDVLKRFFRVDTSRTAAGNGLGLALVAAVVSLHGGTLDLTDGDLADGDLADGPDETESGRGAAGKGGGGPGLCCRIRLPARRGLFMDQAPDRATDRATDRA